MSSPNQNYFDHFELAFNANERSKFWELYFQYGIAFTVMLIITGIVCWQINWRLSRAGSWLAMRMKPTASNSAVGHRARCGVFLAWLCVLLTFGLLFAWGIHAIMTISPLLIGAAMVTVWPAAFMFVYGIMAWYRRNWRMDRGVAQSLTLAFLLICGFEVAVVFDQPYDYVGASWVFLSLNMLVMTLVVGALDPVPYSDTIDAIIHALSQDRGAIQHLRRAATQGQAYLGGFVNQGAGSKHQLVVAGDDADKVTTTRPRMGGAGSDSSGESDGDSELDEVLHRRLQLRGEEKKQADMGLFGDLVGDGLAIHGVSNAAAMYFIAFLVLVAYAITHGVMSSHSKALGFTVAGTVILLDVASALLYRARLVSTPASVCLLMSLARVVLIVWGSDRWVMGFSSVYLVYAVTLSHVIALQRVRQPSAKELLEEAEAEAARGAWEVQKQEAEQRRVEAENLAKAGGAVTITVDDTGNKRSAGDAVLVAEGKSDPYGLNQGAIVPPDADPAAQVPPPEVQRSSIAEDLWHNFTFFGLLRSPEFVLLVLTAGFGGLLLAVELTGMTVPQIKVFTGYHNQTEFGLAAILFVCVFMCISFVRRLYIRGNGTLDALGVALAAFGQILLIGVGIFLKVITDSDIILATCVFSGPAVVCMALIYGVWERDDFDLFKSSPFAMFCFCFEEDEDITRPSSAETHRTEQRIISRAETKSRLKKHSSKGSLRSHRSHHSNASSMSRSRQHKVRHTGDSTRSLVRINSGSELGLDAKPRAGPLPKRSGNGRQHVEQAEEGAVGVGMKSPDARRMGDRTVSTDSRRSHRTARSGKSTRSMRSHRTSRSRGSRRSHKTMHTAMSVRSMRTKASVREEPVIDPMLVRDLSVFVGIVIIFACIFGFGLLTSTSLDPEWLGWLAAGVIAEILCTVVPMYSWFQTLLLTCDEIVTLFLAIALHVGNHGLVLHMLGWDLETVTRASFSFALYPALVLLVVALYKLRDDDWKPRCSSITTFLVSQLCIFGYLVLAVVIYDWQTSAMVGAGYVCSLIFLAVCVKFVANDYSLPRTWHYAALTILALVIAGCLVLTVLEFNSDASGRMMRAVGWGSAAYAIAIVAILAQGFSYLTHSNSLLHFSDDVFPVLTMSPMSGSMEELNRGPLLLIAALGLAAGWGVAATVFVAPYYVGLSAVSIAQVTIVTFVADMMRRSRAPLSAAMTTLRVAKDPRKLRNTLVDAVTTSKLWLDELRDQADRLELFDAEEVFGDRSKLTLDEDVFMSKVLERQLEGAADVADAMLRGKEVPDAAAALVGLVEKQGADQNSSIDSATVNGGRSGSGEVSLRTVLVSVVQLEAALSRATEEEDRFRARVKQAVIEAARAEKAGQVAHWKAFLRWCAEPENAQQLQLLDLGELAYQNIRMQTRAATGVVFRSEEDAQGYWLRRHGLRTGHRLSRNLRHALVRFEEDEAEDRRENRRKRRKDEEAVLERQRRMQDLARERKERAAASGQPKHGGAVREFGSDAKAELGEEEGKQGQGGAAVDSFASKNDNLTDEQVLAIVEQTNKRVGPGGKWEDRDFHGQRALGDDRLMDLTEDTWARPDHFCREGEPAVMVDGFDPSDIEQGVLGDCYLLSALSVLSTRPELLNRVLVSKQHNPHGVYAVRFFKGGAWKHVLVDDLFPIEPSMHTNETGRNIRGPYDPRGYDYKPFALPSFAHSRNSRELWIMLIEKAYAKYHGSYSIVEGGHVHQAMVDMTGGSAEFFNLTATDVKQDIDSGALWKRLKTYHESNHLLGAGSPPGLDTEISAKGIVQGHAYAILRCEEVKDHRGRHQLVQLRNPWGHGEWTGPWSDDDEENWTKRMCAKLGHKIIGDKKAMDDGVFWMSFQDFCANFTDLYVCRLFKTVQEGGKWHKYTTGGRWSIQDGSAAGSTNNPGAEKNPQFYIQTTKACSIFLSLSQSEEDGELFPIGMYLLKKKGNRCKCRYSGETMTNAKYTVIREVTAEAELKHDKHPYTLFVSTFAPRQETRFILTVYSTAPLADTDGARLRRIPDSVPCK